MAIDRDVLTTGEVAKICNVAPRTVSKWFDSGQLKGYRIPGSKDRRIPLGELMRFMKAHGIPMDGITGGRTRVLIVDHEPDVVQVLSDVLGEQTDFEVRSATSAFQAGLECERFRPNVVLVDLHVGDDDGRQVAELVSQSDATQNTRVIAMSGKLTDGQAAGLRSLGFAGFLKKPFPVRRALELIESASRAAA
ncbi:MAG: response regulator [Planctomycetota bacterium]